MGSTKQNMLFEELLDCIILAITSESDDAFLDAHMERLINKGALDEYKKGLESIRNIFKERPTAQLHGAQREFARVEALLKSESFREVFYSRNNGGLLESYTFFANLAEKKYPFTQLHHLHREHYPLIPAANPEDYGDIVDSLKSRKSKQIGEIESVLRSKGGERQSSIFNSTLANKKHFDFDKAIKNTHAKYIYQREIIDEYVIDKRNRLAEAGKRRKELRGVPSDQRNKTDVSLKDLLQSIPFIHPLNDNLKTRTRFEQAHQMLLVPEGEMFLAIFLHRLGDWPRTKEKFLAIGFINDKSQLTGAAERMLHWVRDLPKKHPVSKQIFTDGFNIDVSKLNRCVAVLIDDSDCSDRQIKEFFNLFAKIPEEESFEEDKDKNAEDRRIDEQHRIATNFCFDAFVMDVFLTPYMECLAKRKHSYEDELRYFFVLPIDSLRISNATDGDIQETIFVMNVGFLQQKISSSKHADIALLNLYADEVRILKRLQRLRLLLTTITQPIVRVRIESDYASQRQAAISSARKSAVAAIMGRNMSHNLGSHVLSSLSQLSHDNNREHNIGPIADLHDDALPYTNKIKADIRKNLEKINFNMHAQLHNTMHRYLQSRMDYIARITSQWASWSFPSFFYRDIVAPFIRNYALLDNIVRSERLRYNNINIFCKIICGRRLYTYEHKPFQVELKRGTKPSVSLLQSNTLNYLASLENSNINVTGDKEGFDDSVNNLDISVAIAEGGIGIQAFYSILENFIRNSAKHGRQGRDNKPLVIYITVREEPDNSRVCITINDNCSCITLDDYKNINASLRSDLIDPDNTINGSNWGLKEMALSARFLRKYPEFPVNEEGYNLQAIQDKEGRLGYKFHIETPRFLFFTEISNANTSTRKIGNHIRANAKSIEDIIEQCGPYSLLCIHLKDNATEYISNMLSCLERNQTSIPPRIVVVTDEGVELDFNQHPLLKKRICHVDETMLGSLSLDSNDLDNLYTLTYREWIRFLAGGGGFDHYIGTKPFNVSILFDTGDSGKDKIWRSFDLSDHDGFMELNILDQSCMDADFSTKENHIMLLHHEGRSLLLKYRLNPLDEETLNNYKINALFYETLEKANPIYELITNITTEEQAICFLYQYIESAVIPMLILDERLAERLKRKDPQEMRHGVTTPLVVKVYDESGATSELKVSETSRKTFDDDVVSLTDSSLSKYLVVSAHRSLLDKKAFIDLLNKRGPVFKGDFAVELRNYSPFVYVHSGRGLKSADTPQGVLGINYSSISDYYNDGMPCKYYIVQILLSLRS